MARATLKIIVALLILPSAVLAQSSSSSVSYSFPDRGAATFETTGAVGDLLTGYARIQPGGQTTTPAAFAVIDSRVGDILVSETAVPAAAPTLNATVAAQFDGVVNTGVAIANPNSVGVVVSFIARNAGGDTIRQGSFTLAANTQLARFVNESPYNLFSGFSGSMQLIGTLPIAPSAFRIVARAGGEVVLTNLPISSTAPATTNLVIPDFADGAGWKTRLQLLNVTDSSVSGTIQFFGQGSASAAAGPISMIANGQLSTTFNYNLPARGLFILETGGVPLQVGSIRITPTGGTFAPFAYASLTFSKDGAVVTETNIGADPVSTAFRLYAEATRSIDPFVAFQTAVAVANTSTTPTTVTFDPRNLDGSSAGATVVRNIPASGQIALFLTELFPTLTSSFRGVLRVTTVVTPIAVSAFRARTNELGEFLLTATEVSDETKSSTTGEVLVPQIVDRAGYTTQFVLFSAVTSQSATGVVRFVAPNGVPLNLTTR